MGAPWLKEVTVKNALEAPEARQVVEKFFSHKKRRFKLSTHPNRTLTTTEMDAVIDNWEREEGFVPDLIIVDYADIMAPEIRADFRHQENDKWMRLRAMSQRRHCLLVTVTQTDADSYDKYLLSLKNYSEDKRKFAHVTAMYGLNQDKDDREKEIGILRINEVVVREDDFSKQRQAHVLQNLRRGQPCLSSYW